jgi:cellulose synthase operon protein C
MGTSMLRIALTGIVLNLAFLNTALAEKTTDQRRVLRRSEVAEEDMAAKYKQAAHDANLLAIEQYETFLKTQGVEGEQKAELMFRLAEKYFEEGRYEYYQEMQAYETTYDACFNTPGCDVATQSADNTKSQRWQKKAIRLYTNILTSYPQYPRADEVLYFLGSAYQEVKDTNKAVKQFIRLTQQYSGSRYTADAYVNIGEYYFDNNNAYKALQAYKQATRFQDSPQYGFALYKLAWCYFNVQEYDAAIDHMKQVISYSQDSGDGTAKKVTLQEEALKDLVRFFADAGKTNEAIEYFTKLGKPELINSMLKRLASAYFEQGKFEQCITTYRRLIKMNQNSPDLPSFQNEIIQAYRKIGRKQETTNEIQKMLREYGKKSPWARANAANPGAVKKAEGHIERALREVALSYHKEARKLGAGRQAKETFLLAEGSYRTYLTEFPTGKYTYDMRYSFAEILWELKNYAESYDQYMGVVQIDAKGKHSKDCADSAIFSAIEMVKREKKEGKIQVRKGKTDIEPIDLSVWEVKLLAAMDSFGKTYPEDRDSIKWLYESGELLFSKNRLEEASARYRTVISKNPKSREAPKAATSITEALAFRANAKNQSGKDLTVKEDVVGARKEFGMASKDFASLKETSKAFLEQEGLGDKKFKKDMFEYYQLATGKLVEVSFEASQKTDADKRTAALGFLDYVNTFPKAENADSAVNAAAVYYNQVKDMAKTMETRHYLIEKYPKSKYYTEHVAELGYSYETIANFVKAADWYEKLFALDPEYKATKDALHRAAVFRGRMGEWEQAIKLKRDYIKTYPEDDRTIGMYLDIAQLYWDNGKEDQARQEYLEFYKNPPKGAKTDQIFYARLQFGSILKEQDREDRLTKHWVWTATEYERLDEKEITPFLRSLNAQIQFDQAVQASQTYMDSKISGPPRQTSEKSTNKVLAKQLKDKQEGLKETVTRYNAIALKDGAINLEGGEWAIASITEIGKAYDNYAEAIINSYIPYWLSEGQTEMYQMNLEDRSYQYEQKAIDYYTKALDISFEAQLYNDVSAYVTRRLGELRPSEFPARDEELKTPNYLSSKVQTRTFIETAE